MEEDNMATARKVGKSYQIRVSCGYDRYGMHMEESFTGHPMRTGVKSRFKKSLSGRRFCLKKPSRAGTRPVR
jgi:hypothetical protein